MLITKHIHMLNIPFSIPIAPGVTVERSVNIFLIELRKRLCLVDAGVAGSERAILSYVKNLGHRPDHIRTLILTHAHPDHVGAARAIHDATGCRVMAHWGDRRWIEDTDMQERERPVPGFRTLVAGPVAVDRVIADGETIDLGRFLVDPFHTPGHSRGSLSLYIRSDRALITGDAVPVPGEPPIYEDAANSRMSVKRLAKRPGVDVLLSSWDEPRWGVNARHTFAESLRWMDTVRDTARRTADEGCGPDSPEFGGRVLSGLGISPKAANPLTIRTFLAEMESIRRMRGK